MRNYFDTVLNAATGRPLVGAQVRVLEYPSGDLATIYSDENGTEMSNPLTVADESTSAPGFYQFYAEDGFYSLEYLYNGTLIRPIVNVDISADLTAAQAAATSGAALIGTANGETLADRLTAYGSSGGAARIGSDDGVSGSLFTTVAGFIAKLLSSTGSAIVGFIQSGTGAVSRTTQDKLREIEISVADYGVSPSATAAENLANFNAAIAAAPVGSIVDVPPHADPCVIDTSGGLSAAIEVDKRITIRLRGDLKASHTSAIGANPSYMFNVTADDVTFAGEGRIIGEGTINDTNAGTDSTMPGLVMVTGDRFTFEGPIIVSPPKVGIMLYECEQAAIRDSKFTGGPTAYNDTAYFAIRARLGGKHRFIGNLFYPDEDGGMFVQCIFGVACNGNLATDNIAVEPYEKLLYFFGDRNRATDNTVFGNDSFVPGTNIEGTIGPVIRFHGTNNHVMGNLTYRCSGGAQMMDGAGHVCENNLFLACGQGGISSFASAGSDNNLTGAKFRNNRITREPLEGQLAGDGMRLVSTTAATKLVVEGNDVDGFSVADPLDAIAEWADLTAYGLHSVGKPTTPIPNRYFVVTTGGISGASEPAWDDTPGSTTSDGSVVWTCVAYEGGQAEIKVIGKDAIDPIQRSAVRNNTTSGGQYGIVLNYVTNSQMTSNQVTATSWGFSEGISGGLCSNNNWRFNDVTGTSNTGVQNIDTTSVVFNYTEGSFTPTLHANVATTGTVTATAKWTRVGRRANLDITITATTVEITTSGEIISNIPSAIAGSVNSMGVIGTNAVPFTAGVAHYVASTPTKLYGSPMAAGGSRIVISIGFTI